MAKPAVTRGAVGTRAAKDSRATSGPSLPAPLVMDGPAVGDANSVTAASTQAAPHPYEHESYAQLKRIAAAMLVTSEREHSPPSADTMSALIAAFAAIPDREKATDELSCALENLAREDASSPTVAHATLQQARDHVVAALFYINKALASDPA